MRLALIVFSLFMTAVASNAQQAQVPFGGGFRADTSAPVEVSADSLNVNQQDGTATFVGNVIVGQGQMRLSAQEVQVVYATGGGSIDAMRARGGVTLVNGTDAAEAQEADYTVGSGVIVMRGDVLLTQGGTALSSDSLTVNLATGSAQMTGRVKTILNAGTD